MQGIDGHGVGRGRGRCGGGRQRRRMRNGCGGRKGVRPLSECGEDEMHVIVENDDKQSMEMGLFAGARVRVIKNTLESLNMVVAINDSRYMLSKDTARMIRVK